MSDHPHAIETGVYEQPTTAARIEGRIAQWLSHVPGSWLLRLIGERPLKIDGNTMDAHMQFVVAAQRRKGHTILCEPTPVKGRARYRREIAAVTTSPTTVATVRDLDVAGATGLLSARHYAPSARGSEAAPLLVFLHGGGFVIGDIETHDEPCRVLCQYGGMHVLSVAYRLAPEHPFPGAVDDSVAALRWAQDNAAALGANPSMVCVGGDSAGGNLAIVAALQLAREGRATAAQLLIYPTTDANAKLPSATLFASGFLLERGDMIAFSRHYLSGERAAIDDPRVSPLRAPDLALSPPTVIVTAGFDPLRDEGDAFAAALRAVGVTVHARPASGLVHGFLHMTTVVPEAKRVLIDLAVTLRAVVTAGSVTR